VARDATARLYDVDAGSIAMDKKAGTIIFRAKKGRLVDLDRLHESIWATRLGDRTGMQLHRLHVTAVGEVVVAGGDVKLKVPGSEDYFLLRDGGGGDTFRRLREAAGRGAKQVRVTGRVDGWGGNFTRFLSTLPPRPRSIIVEDFKAAGG
jgi:hypothetical protein